MIGANIDAHSHADVSEFRLRKLMQSSASPFVISNAVRDTWLSTGIHPLGGPVADSELVGRWLVSCGAGGQIHQLCASPALPADLP
jgi:hypothetical protein